MKTASSTAFETRQFVFQPHVERDKRRQQQVCMEAEFKLIMIIAQRAYYLRLSRNFKKNFLSRTEDNSTNEEKNRLTFFPSTCLTLKEGSRDKIG